MLNSKPKYSMIIVDNSRIRVKNTLNSGNGIDCDIIFKLYLIVISLRPFISLNLRGDTSLQNLNALTKVALMTLSDTSWDFSKKRYVKLVFLHFVRVRNDCGPLGLSGSPQRGLSISFCVAMFNLPVTLRWKNFWKRVMAWLTSCSLAARPEELM